MSRVQQNRVAVRRFGARRGRKSMLLSAVIGVAAASSAHAASYYWVGDNSSVWNSAGGPALTNWSISPDFNNDPNNLPGAGDDVFFYFGFGSNLDTTLGADFSIRSLNFTSTAFSPVNIGGTNTLTIGSGGINIQNGAFTPTINTNIALSADQTWTNNATFQPLVINGTISGGAVNLTTAGTGTINIANAATYTGTTTVATGTLRVSGANGSLATSAITINSGQTFTLDSTQANHASQNRIGDAVPITMNGGTFNLLGSFAGDTGETVGTLKLNAGASYVNAVPGGANATLTFGSASLASINRSMGGTVNFSANGTIKLPNVTLVNPTNPIIGGYATIGPMNGSGLNWATVDGTGKVVPLANYQTFSQSSTASDNAKYDASSGSSVLITSDVTVNTLYLTGGSTPVTGVTVPNTNKTYYNGITFNQSPLSTSTITVGAGGIISSGATGIGHYNNKIDTPNMAFIGYLFDESGTATGRITSSTGDLNIITDSNLRIASIITGNINLVKSGPGLLDLSNGNTQGAPATPPASNSKTTNTFTGKVIVNEGILLFNNELNLGAQNLSSYVPDAVILNGGELLTYAGTNFNVNRGITVGTRGGTIAYSGGGTTNIQNPITGPGGITVWSNGSLDWTNNNNSRGGSGTQTVNLANASATHPNDYQGDTNLWMTWSFNPSFANVAIGALGLTQNNQIPSTSAVNANLVDGNGVIQNNPITINGTQRAVAGINMNGKNQSFGSLAGNLNLNNHNGTLTLGGNNLSTTYTGAINGTGSLIKNGTGRQTFTGVNTYTGATTINGGALVVATGGAISSSTGGVTIGPVGTLAGYGNIGGNVTVNGHLAPAETPTSTGAMSIAGNLTFNPGSSLDLHFGFPFQNDQIFASGAVTFLAGVNDVLNITDLTGFGVGTYTLINAGTSLTDNAAFTINGSSLFNYRVLKPGDAIDARAGGGNVFANQLVLEVTPGNPAFTWAGTISSNWDTTTGNWASNGAGNLYQEDANVTFDDSGINTNINVRAAGVNPHSMTFNNVLKSYTFGGGAIGGGGSLVKNSAGSVTFNNTASYTGTTRVNGGTLTVGATGSLSATPSITTASGTNLNVAGSLNPAVALVLNGNATFSNASQSVASITDDGSSSGVITLTGTALTIGSGSISNVITGSGSITKDASAGTLVLGANNTYSGGTTINGGVVQISSDASLGTAPASPAVNLTLGGGTLQLNGPINLNPNRTISLTASTNSTIDTQSNNVTLAGKITGGGGWTKAGSGTAVLSGIVDNTGGASVTGGTLRVTNSGTALGTTGPIATSAGATLQLDPGAGSVNLSSAASMTNDGLLHVKSGTTNLGNVVIGSTRAVPVAQLVSPLAESFYRPKDVSSPENPTLFSNTNGVADPYIQLENPTSLLAFTPSSTGTLKGTTQLSFQDGNSGLNQILNRAGGATAYPAATGQPVNEQEAVVWKGSITIGAPGGIAAGSVSFGTDSDDGSNIYVDLNRDGQFTADERVVSNGGSHGVGTPMTGSVNLAAGTYPIAIAYFQGTGSGSIEARVAAGANVAYADQSIISPVGVAGTGSQVQIDAGASLIAGGITAGTLTMNTDSVNAATLSLSDNSTLRTSTVGQINIAGTAPHAILNLGGNNALTANSLVLPENGTLDLNGSITGSGPRKLAVVAHSFGNGSTVNVGPNTTLAILGPGDDASGQVLVAANGTLATGGGGSVAGLVSISSQGHLAAPSSGTFTFGNLTLSGGSAVDFDLSAGSQAGEYLHTADFLAAVGGGTIDFNVGTPAPGLYHLFNVGGQLTLGGGSLGNTFHVVGTAPAGASFSLTQNGTFIDLTIGASLIWNGAPGSAWDTTSANWQAGKIYAETNQPVFDDTATGSTDVNITSEVHPSIVTVSANAKNYSFNGAAIAGNAILQKSGSGTLTLNNQNTYTGGTTITGGKVVYGVDNALPMTGQVQISNGATLDIGFHSATLGSLSATDSTVDGGGTLIAGAVALANSTINPSLQVSGGLTVSGTGTVTLNGFSNTFTGAINVAQGTLTTGGSAAISAPSLTVNGNANLNGNTTIQGSVQVPQGTLTVGTTGFFSSTGMSVGDATHPGGVNINGSANLSGPMTITQGSVTVGTGASLSATGINVGGGTAASLNSSGNLSAATIAVNNLGVLNANAANSAGTGAITVSAGGIVSSNAASGVSGAAITVAPSATIVSNAANALDGANVTLNGTLRVAVDKPYGAPATLTLNGGSYYQYDVGQATSPNLTIPAGVGLFGNTTGFTYGASGTVKFARNAVLNNTAGPVPTRADLGNDAILLHPIFATDATGNYSIGVDNTSIFRGFALGSWSTPNAGAVNPLLATFSDTTGNGFDIDMNGRDTTVNASTILNSTNTTTGVSFTGGGNLTLSANPGGTASVYSRIGLFDAVNNTTGSQTVITLPNVAGNLAGKVLNVSNLQMNFSGINVSLVAGTVNFGPYSSMNNNGASLNTGTFNFAPTAIYRFGNSNRLVSGATWHFDDGAMIMFNATGGINLGTANLPGNVDYIVDTSNSPFNNGNVTLGNGRTIANVFSSDGQLVMTSPTILTAAAGATQVRLAGTDGHMLSINGDANFSGVEMVVNGSAGETIYVPQDNGVLAREFGGSAMNGTVRVTGNATAGSVTIKGGTYLVPANGTLTTTGNISNAGTFNILGTVTSGGALTSTTAAGDSSKYAGSTTVGDGSAPTQLNVGFVRQDTLTVSDQAKVTISDSGGSKSAHVSVLSNLNLNNTGVLDLTNNDLVVHYAAGSSPEAQIQQYVNNWKTSAGGPMLMASKFNDASSIFTRTLAVADNANVQFKTFDGQTFAPGDFNQILVKYTYLGDANLDGVVTPTDYAIVDGNIGSNHDWGKGDLNGDGNTTPADYAQIDGNIGAGNGTVNGGPQLSDVLSVSSPSGAGFSSVLAVPEPGTLSLLAVGALGLLARRRRRN